MLRRTPPTILQRSGAFRRPLTPTDNKACPAVRRRPLGFKIRRQHPIGKFVVDFRRAKRSFPCDARRELRQSR